MDNSLVQAESMKPLQTMKKLSTLSVADCPKMSDSTLGKILQSNAAITDLDISWCLDLLSGEKSLKFLGGVKRLVASGVLMESSTIKLAGFCHNLTELDASWCKKISDDALTQLIKANESLKRIDIANCKGLTKEGMNKIQNDRKEMKILHSWGF